MVAFETLHCLQRYNSSRHGYTAIKLDMSKAYDRVEWHFLEGIMKKMGFNEGWIKLIMLCVSTVTYSVLVNGEPSELIHPTRGIRQGDPLSPFLFLLCTEGLNGMIKKAEMDGDIHGFSLCRRGPKLTHLLFADDCLLFCRATMDECGRVLDILKDYEEASGQKINKTKTALFFSKATDAAIKNNIKEAWGVPEIMQYEKYLGLPSFVGKGKKASFNYIKERVWRKIQGWEGKLLSQAGREVLIKSVIQAIPTYTMGCFKIPLGLCNEIEAMIKKFWWGQRGDRRKIHWVKWNDLTKSKAVGGIGFKDLAMYNDSLLAKQAWRLLHDHNSLFYKVFKARFFPNTSRLGIQDWALMHGGVFSLGGTLFKGERDSSVDILIDPQTRQWNVEMVEGLFHEEEAELIKQIPLSSVASEDILYWPYSSNDVYSSKSGYKFLKMEEELMDRAHDSVVDDDSQVWKMLWSMNAPQKVKTLLWRACREALPTKCSLFWRKITEEDLCVRCRAATENSLHALWSCTELDLVWEDPELWSFRNEVQFLSFKELLSWIIKHTQLLELFAVTVWSIWNQRNHVRLNQPADAIHQIAYLSKKWLAEYQARQVSPGPSLIHTQPTRCRWLPPPSGAVKINFDGATFPKEKKSGIGVVIRDTRGLVIASCSKVVHQVLSVSDIEALAAAWALSFASDVGVRQAILEGDSLTVISDLREDGKVLAPYGLLLEDVKVLSLHFEELRYSHTKREGNSLAHGLARYALSIPDLLVWMEDVLPQFYYVLQTDLPSFS
ncbi:hypothetical protein SO802_033489 [Lithocarpus litseifolius]|uniref:Reverse transcriptase domain-containing protein n=1 Tax=Lithocarpus litseifolius TaxID=425828 RepID=A0AAW2BDB0_9ROSI